MSEQKRGTTQRRAQSTGRRRPNPWKEPKRGADPLIRWTVNRARNQAVYRVIAGRQFKPLTSRQIAEAVGTPNRNAVKRALVHLRRHGLIDVAGPDLPSGARLYKVLRAFDLPFVKSADDRCPAAQHRSRKRAGNAPHSASR